MKDDQETLSGKMHITSLHWLNSTAGRYLQAKEQALYDQAVFDLFGFNALQMGGLGVNLLRNSRVTRCYRASDCLEEPCDVVCSDDFLPFPEMSLDVLLLPHRLEFSAYPHQTLREAARVMMPEGHLLISGFNPMSIWGLWAIFKKRFSKHQHDLSHQYPWSAQLISLPRLKDWLALLGFEVVSVTTCCHVPPVDNTVWHQRLSWMDKQNWLSTFGGVYFIVAKKRVVGMTLLKPQWRASLRARVIAHRQPSGRTKTTPSQKIK